MGSPTPPEPPVARPQRNARTVLAPFWRIHRATGGSGGMGYGGFFFDRGKKCKLGESEAK